MQCPNCQFEIEDGSTNCPFCAFIIGESADVGKAMPGQGGGVEADFEVNAEVPGDVVLSDSEGGVPTPGEDPDLQDLGAGAMDPLAQTFPEASSGPVIEPDPVPAESPSAPSAASSTSSPVKLVVIILIIAGAGFAAFKLLTPKPAAPGFVVKTKPLDPAQESTQAPREPTTSVPSAPLVSKDPAVAPDEGGSGTFPEENSPVGADPRMAAILEAQKPKQPQSEAGVKPAEEAPRPPATWIFQGTVRDIITFAPVPKAQMLFLNTSGGSDFQTTTNSQGRYQVTLPGLPTGGYSLMVDHMDYLGHYFDGTVAGYKKISRERRFRLRSATPQHKPWAGEPDGPVRRDVFLFPDITD